MSSRDTQPSKSGIVTDADGHRHIPASTRADGSTRREIKIRPGYRPPEDVELYRNRAAEAFRTPGKSKVPGAESKDEDGKPGAAASSNKNAKRREARRKAKAATADGLPESQEAANEDSLPLGATTNSKEQLATQTPDIEVLQNATAGLTIDPEAEKDKKIKKLKKKLREARELQQKKERGEGLLPEQLQKAIRINEIIRELGQLGHNADEDFKDV